jgi:arylsulfatase A-like enzyme
MMRLAFHRCCLEDIKKLMHISPILITALLSISLSFAEKTRPNIIVILSDDHGWADIGAQSSDPHLKTPNLDQLCKDGVRFSRGYVTAPQCTPSRAGLMSGQYQNKFGVDENFDAMRSEVITLPERLKKSGYTTGISGKWHLNVIRTEHKKEELSELAPWNQGFDEYFTGVMHTYHASHALDGSAYADAPKIITEKNCRVAMQTDWALQFLKRRANEPNKEKPFFLYLAYMAPHTPLGFPNPWIDQVPKNLPRERRSALALLAAIDDGLGRLRQQLKEMHQSENTLIFFLGDNGAPLMKKAWDGSLNLPMLGEKGMLSEGGIRVPFIAAWPGNFPAGKVFDLPVSSLDITGTAVASAGIAPPPEFDGVDLSPFLKGENKASPHQTLYWRWADQAAILEFPHKLIQLGTGKRMLFDVTSPNGEHHSNELSAQHPEIVSRLQTKLGSWMNSLEKPGAPKKLIRENHFIQADILPGK